MRALPLIERVLIIGGAALVLMLMIFLLAWHLRWNALQRTIAAAVPHPGVTLATGTTDPVLLADFHTWCNGLWTVPGFTTADDNDDALAFWLTGSATPPPDVALVMRSHGDASLRELDALLARGLHPVMRLNGPDLDGDPAGTLMLDASIIWRIAARLDGDPTAAINAQTTIFTALSPASDIWVQGRIDLISHHRDATALVAALTGHLSDRTRARWRENPDALLADVLSSRERERCYCIPGRHAALFAMDPITYGRRQHTYSPTMPWSAWPDILGQWWHEPTACAERMQEMDNSEDIPRGLPPRDSAIPPDVDLMEVSAHRLALLADDVLSQRAADGTLPSDPHLDLAPGPTRLGLRYQLLSGNIFTISVDPDHPGPPALVLATTRGFPDPATLPVIYLTAVKVVVDCSGGAVGTPR